MEQVVYICLSVIVDRIIGIGYIVCKVTKVQVIGYTKTNVATLLTRRDREL